MKRWLLTHGETSYELVPGEATLVGRSAPSADFIVPVATMSRAAASFTWRGGAWWIRDANSAGGTFIRGERINGAALDDGAVVTVGGVDVTVSSFDADPLDDIFECEGWVAYGRRRPDEYGRWPAFRRRNGQLERGLLILGGDADDLPGAIDRGSNWYVRPAALGVPLAIFAEALAAAPADAIAFGSFVKDRISRAPPPVDASDLVVTWDGVLMRLPPRRTRPTPHDDVKDLFPVTLWNAEGESFGFPPPRLSPLLRALCENEWRAEVELREQLEALDDKGVRWLLERNQRTP